METINRDFVRRGDDKPLGSITLHIPSLDGWQVEYNGKRYDLPSDSAFASAFFSLQMFQDAYAGKQLKAEAVAAFDAKVKRWLSGTLGARSAATGATAVERAAWGLAMKDILAAAKVKTVVKLAERDDVTESETGNPFVSLTEAGNVSYDAAAMRAFVKRNDATQRYMERAEAIVAAKAGDDAPAVAL